MRLTKSCKISLHKKVNISIASARSAGQEETSWWEQHGSGRWADQRGVAKEIDDNDQDDDDGDGDDGYGDDDDGDGDNQVNELVAGATVKVEADGGDGHQQMVGDTTFILYPFFSAHCAGPKGPCACYWQTDPHSEGGWDFLACIYFSFWGGNRPKSPKFWSVYIKNWRKRPAFFSDFF